MSMQEFKASEMLQVVGEYFIHIGGVDAKGFVTNGDNSSPSRAIYTQLLEKTDGGTFRPDRCRQIDWLSSRLEEGQLAEVCGINQADEDEVTADGDPIYRYDDDHFKGLIVIGNVSHTNRGRERVKISSCVSTELDAIFRAKYNLPAYEFTEELGLEVLDEDAIAQLTCQDVPVMTEEPAAALVS